MLCYYAFIILGSSKNSHNIYTIKDRRKSTGGTNRYTATTFQKTKAKERSRDPKKIYINYKGGMAQKQRKEERNYTIMNIAAKPT